MPLNYKTPVLHSYVSDITSYIPLCMSSFTHFQRIFSDIDLPDKSEKAGVELFGQPLFLGTAGYVVNITWRIDELIQFLPESGLEKKLISAKYLVNNYFHFSDPAYYDAYKKVCSSIRNHEIYTHKTDFIIITSIDPLPGLHVIDGVHRLFEAYCSNQDIFVYRLPPEYQLQYLFPNSAMLIRAIRELHFMQTVLYS